MMPPVTADTLASYWSAPEVSTNLLIFLNMAGALALGLLVGYERSYHGRAAGMRTYGLVCMASAALTVIVGYPGYWYGGGHVSLSYTSDPTRIIQGVVTGIGFLGAGVIMKEGLSISGLTTSASIWASSAIGILVGLGFYAAAMALALMCAACMMWVSRLEGWLPSRPAIGVTIRFRKDFLPREDVLRRFAFDRGYEVATGSITISHADGQTEWRFVAVALTRHVAEPIPTLANELCKFDGLETFSLAHARN